MKKFKKFLKGLLIVILILAVIHGIASMVLSRRVASKLAEIKTQGDPVSLADLGKIDIPDSENGATIYMQIFKEMGTPIEYKNGKYVINWDKWDDKKSIEFSRLLNARKFTPDMWVELKKLLAPYQHAMDMVDEATARPRCKFQSNWGDYPNITFPQITNVLILVGRMQLDAQISAHDGNMDKAVHRVGQIFEVSKSALEDPIINSLYSRTAMISRGLDGIKQITQDNKMSITQLKYLDGILSRIDLRNSYLLEMKGERVMGLYTYNTVSGKSRLSDMPWYDRIVFSVLRPFYLMDALLFLHHTGVYLQNVDLPYIKMPLNKIKHIDDEYKPPKFAMYSSLLVEGYAYMTRYRDTAISKIRSGRAYLGLITYKEKFGTYPQSLDELRSKLGWKVEVDPLTGKDFHYERRGAGFLLYGVGPNLHDDGGIKSFKRVPTRPSDQYDDIVWQLAK